jgi:dUTP pyrophosphatase
MIKVDIDMCALPSVNFKKLTPFATTPTRGTPDSAGLDLYAADTMTIPIHTCVKIPTDIAMEIPSGYFGGVYSRSGTATKRGLRIAQGVAIIDSDYRGNIIVPLFNDSDQPQIVERGERIAQLVVQPYLQINLNLVDELTETERGVGGFGSTGTN